MSEIKELKKQWKNQEFARCYLFYGTEFFLLKEYESALKHALLPDDAELMNFDLFEGKRATAAAIMDAAETMPFLNDRRLVLIRNSEFFQKGGRKEEGEALKTFLPELPESTCVVFIEEKAEKTSALYKCIAKCGQIAEFKRPSEKDLGTWVKRRGREKGLELSDSVVDFFLQTVDHDMENIEQELQKLSAYQSGAVRPEDIRAVCTISLEARVFDLVRAVAERRAERAVQIYRNLIQMKESPYMVLSLMTRQFRMILETLLLLEGGRTQGEIAAKLEIRDFAVREYAKQAKRFSAAGWKKALRDCLETDLQIKSGKMGEEAAVELLIMTYSSISS